MTQKENSHKIQRWFKMVIALFAAAVLIASCSDKDDSDNALSNAPAQPNENIRPDIPEQPTPDAPKTYTLSIPATFGGDGSLSKRVTLGGTEEAPTATGTFDATEKIYVYNETKSAMCSDDDNYLSPTDISTDGKSCTLSGKFIGTIEEGDQITLLYNLSSVYSDPTACVFTYDDASDIIDGGIAEGLEVTSTDDDKFTTESQAVFQLCQSIFRFKFVDDDENAINVKTLLIESDAITKYYRPLKESDKYGQTQVTKTFAPVTSDYINIALCINENYKTNAFSFTVIDGDNNIYKGTKDAPSAGFKNGEYYYNTTPISLKKQAALVEPTITWGEGTPEVTPNQYRQYDVYGPFSDGHRQPSTLTISGISKGYYFYLNSGSTTTLDYLTAIRDDREFINSSGNLNLTITGKNTITCKKLSQAIFVDGTLKISGNGTLTVTVNSDTRKGLYATSNYNNKNNSDPSVLAADGYTVTISDMIDNGDGTYTWTYTVQSND